MAAFTGEDLAGSRFEDVDVSGARFHNVDLTGAKIRGALLVDVDINGEVDNVRINDVDVGPLIEGYPPPDTYAVRRCLQAVMNEEWAHRLYAERDLAVLEARS